LDIKCTEDFPNIVKNITEYGFKFIQLLLKDIKQNQLQVVTLSEKIKNLLLISKKFSRLILLYIYQNYLLNKTNESNNQFEEGYLINKSYLDQFDLFNQFIKKIMNTQYVKSLENCFNFNSKEQADEVDFINKIILKEDINNILNIDKIFETFNFKGKEIAAIAKNISFQGKNITIFDNFIFARKKIF
jgi:hypothetical protein